MMRISDAPHVFNTASFETFEEAADFYNSISKEILLNKELDTEKWEEIFAKNNKEGEDVYTVELAYTVPYTDIIKDKPILLDIAFGKHYRKILVNQNIYLHSINSKSE